MVHVNEEVDGSPGGFIEAVKRTVVVSLRRALTESGLSLNDSVLHVDMEYPEQKTSYPSVWVQFSFSELTDSGLGHREFIETESGKSSTRVKQWRYRGRVTLTIMTLSSLDRDRIADKLISIYAFSDIESSAYDAYEDPSATFLKELNKSPYVSMTLQSGLLTAQGQGTSVGTPWDPMQLVYEDTYSFILEGEFQQTYTPEDGYRLTKIEVVPTHTLNSSANPIKPGEYI